MYKPIEKAIYKGPDYKEPESALKKTLAKIYLTIENFSKTKLPLIKRLSTALLLILILVFSLVILFKFANRKTPQQAPPPNISVASPQIQTQVNTDLQNIQKSLDDYDQEVDNMTKTTTRNFPPPKVDLNVTF